MTGRAAMLTSTVLALAALQPGPAWSQTPVKPSPGVSLPPNDVVAYTSRLSGCNHWAGEEAYDAARARMIAAGLKRLRCDDLEADEKRLRLRHAGTPEVMKALDRARDAEG